MSENYQPDLYVEREELFGEIRDWIQLPMVDYRLRSLVGAAGIGKSWFMADTYRRLRYEPNCLPIWLDLSQEAIYPDLGDGTPEAGQPFPDCRTKDGRRQWLKTVIEQVKTVCSTIVTYNPDVTFDALFAEFVATLCQNCSRYTPILLVDGYDEITSAFERDYLQEYIFATFLSKSCTRILLARRDTYLLTHPYLNWNDQELLLTGFNAKQREEQITLLEQHLQQGGKEDLYLERIKQVLSPFVTNNPFINTFLFKRARRSIPPSISYPSDLEDCIETIVARAGLDPRSLELLELIVQQLPETWSVGHLKFHLGIGIDDPILDDLFRAGIVSQIPGTYRYKVEIGIYELFQRRSNTLLIRLSGEDINSFTKDKQKQFIYELAKIAEMDPERIRILEIKPGSVNIKITVNDEILAWRLIDQFRTGGGLQAFGITSILLEPMDPAKELPALVDKIYQAFADNELRDLCFRLEDINSYEDLPGSTTEEKVRELVLFFARREKVDILIQQCHILRPGQF